MNNDPETGEKRFIDITYSVSGTYESGTGCCTCVRVRFRLGGSKYDKVDDSRRMGLSFMRSHGRARARM